MPTQKGTIMSVDTTVLERTIIFDKLNEIYELCRKYNVKRLELFGSALRDDFAPERSDIDFLVEYRHHTPEEHYENFFGLWEALQAMFGRDIDLVESSAIKNPYFREAVESTKVPLYVAP
jgi:predicted nucleotidyltransferase